MKNKIWRNWKMTGAALIMSCSLLMGSGSAVLGAELAESDIFLEDVEAMDPSGESETEQELDLAEVVDEIRTTEAAETSSPVNAAIAETAKAARPIPEGACGRPDKLWRLSHTR